MLNYGTKYPPLPKLEQEGHIASEWRVSKNSRNARSTRAGQVQPRFFAPMETL
jgi:hypothetical protein